MIDYAISELERNMEMEAAEAVRKMKEELRATKHALWMARAEAARKEIRWWIDDKGSYPTYRMCALHDVNSNSGKTMFPQEWVYLWMEIHRKCREKAKEDGK